MGVASGHKLPLDEMRTCSMLSAEQLLQLLLHRYWCPRCMWHPKSALLLLLALAAGPAVAGVAAPP